MVFGICNTDEGIERCWGCSKSIVALLFSVGLCPNPTIRPCPDRSFFKNAASPSASRSVSYASGLCTARALPPPPTFRMNAAFAASVPKSLRAERRFALDAAKEACSIILRAPRELAVLKADGSPVTAADLAVQAAVSRALRSRLALDALVAEEDMLDGDSDGALARTVAALAGLDASAAMGKMRGVGVSSWAWALDPIDGSKGFLTDAGFAFGLALLQDGGARGCPQLAALALPTEQTVLIAQPDELDGSFFVECPLICNDDSDCDEMMSGLGAILSEVAPQEELQFRAGGFSPSCFPEDLRGSRYVVGVL